MTTFTASQTRAIQEIESNLQIIACAGSGKTRVVANRIVHILSQQGDVSPENIVAFTFTEKAAAELKHRIFHLYQATFGNQEGLAGMFVGTIHAYCLDLLQRYLVDYLKYDVLDEVRQRLLIDRYSTQSGLSSLGLTRWRDSRLYIQILGVLRGSNVESALIGKTPVWAAYEKYVELLDRRRYLDYDGILVKAVAALQGDESVREQIRQKVRYVTVDEYQDINPIQEALIRELHDLGANLCVVGDDDQNIYQWRGSDVQHIVDFDRRYPNVTRVNLATNFRSTEAVVATARESVQVNSIRLEKEMEAGGRRKFERGDLLALQFTSRESEARWIAEKIGAMRGVPYQEEGRLRGLSWSDFVILLRSVKNSAGPIVDALRARGIPNIVTGLSNLFDTPEARAAVGIFSYISGEIDSGMLFDLWERAKLGLSNNDIQTGIRLLERLRTLEPGVRYDANKLQLTFLDFLEAIKLREDRVPGGHGEVVFYNLGKFSQVISDYEEVNFRTSDLAGKYAAFVQFLRHQAPDYYPEGGQDHTFSTPDAVRIMTVHAAKGLEFPVLFLPCLQRNRFPAARQANRVWQHLPKASVQHADRYDSSDEDERRLFYVALTRGEKYLFCSWAPTAEQGRYSRPSEYFVELTRRSDFLTRDPNRITADRLPPQPRQAIENVEFTFTDLKYLFTCPYQFKLRLLYGFNPPISEKLGYGRSLHNALAEIHRRSLDGDIPVQSEVEDIVGRHLQLRYATPRIEEDLRGAAVKSVDRYLQANRHDLDKLEHAEETIQLTLENAVVVNGRIDLIKHTDTQEVVVVDFKSTQRAQDEDVTRLQLHIYAVGYKERFGQNADLIEIHNLDEGGPTAREVVDNHLTESTLERIQDAGNLLRENRFERLREWKDECGKCDFAGICRERPAKKNREAGRAESF